MKKNFMALVCAGLLGMLSAFTASAQTNVTLYGLVDYGYTYRFDGRGLGGNGGTPSSQSQLNGGQSAENRIGFKGTEDLGNGLKALFTLEQGFNIDTGDQYQSNKQFSRQAYVGLSGDFGTVIGGRLYTPHYQFVSSIDPFRAGTIGSYRNVYSPASALTNYGTLTDPINVDNAVSYTSPTWNGVTGTVFYSNNVVGQEASASNSGNNTLYGGLVKYETGPIMVGLNYHFGAAGTNNPGLKETQSTSLGGTYDFKVAKVAALYSYNTVAYNVAGSGDAILNNYLIGVTAPYGKWTGKASYQYSDGNRSAGGDAQQLAVGVDYNLSKRTAFYTAYSWIDNSNQRYNAVGDASNSGGYTGNGYTAGVFQQGVQAGIRHAF